jgi:hypothetical protein
MSSKRASNDVEKNPSSRRNTLEATLARKSMLKTRLAAPLPSHPLPPDSPHVTTSVRRTVQIDAPLQNQKKKSGVVTPQPSGPDFLTASRILPGNAGAIIDVVEAHNAVPVSPRAANLAAQDAALASGNKTQMEFLSPTMLQMQIEKQTRKLNSMAVMRHSMVVQSQLRKTESTISVDSKSS